MAGCDDTRQLTEDQRQDGHAIQRTGVQQAVRPYTSSNPSLKGIVDYLNREVYPALRATRQKINDVYRQVTDNAPSANPLDYYFSTETAVADPTAGRLRLNSAGQDSATSILVSGFNSHLKDVSTWLVIMAGSSTDPLGVVTLSVADDPSRFIRFDLEEMTEVGDYWQLDVTTLESSSTNPFVDGGPVVLAFIPGVASGGGAGAVVRIPGQPFYDVMAKPFNATGSLAGDDTAAINAAIAAANAVPGTIYLGPAHRITAGLDPITNNNIRIIGRGEFNGGTILQVDSATAVDAITISGCQYCSVERMWITGTKVFTSGYGIRFVGTFRCFTDHVVITTMCFGVEHVNCTLSLVQRTHLGDLYGVYGFLARGTGGNFNHAVFYDQCVCGTNYPGGVVGAGTVWASGTAYVVGNIVFANNNIYQCVQSGTSGASAPSGAGTTASNAHTVQITDGTVKWVFAMPLNVWFCQESGSQTFEVVDCGTLQGGYGLLVDDSTGSGPLFTRVQNFQVDHPFSAGIQLNAGAAIRMNQVLVTSVQEGSGIVIGSGVQGNWEFIGGEVFGCNKAGITIAKGDGVLEGIQIGACGGISSNTRDCIEVTNSASRFRIVGCSGGAMLGATSPSTRYGLSIAAGSDHYTVVGNVFASNLTGGILNTPGRASTRVVLNNDPDVTISPGSTWGLQVDGSTGVPIEITGLEQGENLRRENFVVTTSTGTTTTFTIANTTTQIVCKSTAALTIRGMTATSATFGKTIEFSMHAGFAGSVTFNNEDGSAAAALERIACPENTNLTITAGQVAVLTYFDSRWRVVAVSRAGVGLTDGDKGDITVSSSGTVWEIDASVITATELASNAVTTAKILDANVTLAKQADLAQSRIIGRAEGAGTGVPQALTPTQVVAIIDAEAVTWTGAHSFTGSSHTVDTAGAITMEGDSDCSLASTAGGLALGAGHVVVSPTVGNGDVVVNATSGVGINAHATTPVTGAATGNVELTASADVLISTGDQLDVAAENGLRLRGQAVSSRGGNIRFEGDTAPATLPAAFEVELYATSGTPTELRYRTTALSENVGFTANSNSVQTANGTQTNSTTNITITSVAPSANAWASGTVYRLEGYFVYAHTAAATPTITLELLIQGSVVESLVITPVAVATTYAGRAVATIVCRTTGAGGTAMCSLQCINDFGDVTSQSNAFSKATTADALDTTTAASLVLRVRMTTAVASNTLTVIEGFATRLA